MTTIKKYFDVVKAEMDKSVLEAAGIPAFVAGESSAAIGYGGNIAELRLQVDDGDAERAFELLKENAEATPLSDDFIPPETAPSENSGLEVLHPDRERIVSRAILASLLVFVLFVALGWWKISHTFDAYYRRGYGKWTKGDVGGAIADFDRSIAINPSYSRAYEARGTMKQAQDKIDEAITDYNSAIAMDRGYARGYWSRGSAERAKGDFNAALTDIDHAMDLGLQDARTYYDRGVVRYDLRNWMGALADFLKASSLEPASSPLNTWQDYARIQIWMARSRLGERNAATEQLKEYLHARTTGTPNDWPAPIIRYLIGDMSEVDFVKSANIGDQKRILDHKCEADFYAGTMRLINGDKLEATQYFKKCLETGAEHNYEYQSAAAELAALDPEPPLNLQH